MKRQNFEGRYNPHFFDLGGIILSITLARFYRSNDSSYQHLYHRLKLTSCPHCKLAGTLILHGKLYGYDEHAGELRSCRGFRIFCNIRKKRNNGCGLTSSVWADDKNRRTRLGAKTLWAFLKLVVCLGNTAQALRDLNIDFSISSAYRVWKRFVHAQSHIRTTLTHFSSPPKLPGSRQPADQTLAHMEAAFPGASCPIAAFQNHFQFSFL